MGCLLTEFKLTAMQCGESSPAFGAAPLCTPPTSGWLLRSPRLQTPFLDAEALSLSFGQGKICLVKRNKMAFGGQKKKIKSTL